MKDLIVIGGAPGTGKTTISKLLAQKLGSFVFDFGILREVHLDKEWSNQSLAEEQMSFENLLFILKNYKKNNYKNVILNDLQDFRLKQIPDVLTEFNYMIVTLYVQEDEDLRKRVLGERDSGYKNADAAIKWNREVIDRPAVKNEIKIDNSHNKPEQTVDKIFELVNG